MTYQETIAEIASGHFTDVDIKTPLSDLGIDSLDLLEFVMAIEEKFDVEIEADLVDLNKGLDQFIGILEARHASENTG